MRLTTDAHEAFMNRMLPSPTFLLLLALALAAMPGCYQSVPAPPPTTVQSPTRIEPAPENVVASQPAAAPAPEANDASRAVAAQSADGRLIEEIWEAFSIQGSRAGYGHTTISEVEEEGQTLVRTEGDSRMVLKRAGQTTTQDMKQISWDTKEGRLVRFECRMTAGTGEVVTTGKVVGDKLEIAVGTLGKAQTQTIPWQSEWGGLFAADQSLRRRPLEAGEKRTVRGLMPVLNSVCDTELEAISEEIVVLPAFTVPMGERGTTERKLLRINASMDLGGQKLATVLWVNDKGETLKSLIPSLQQETVRTTKQDAMQLPAAGAQLDLLAASVVKLKEPLENALTTKKVVYRAHVTSGKIEKVFADCLSQRIRPIDDATAELTIISVRPGSPKSLDVAVAGPRDADLAPSSMIQSDDPLVVKMAAAAAPEGEDVWSTARTLEKYVAGTIKKKNFSQAFATAAEVCRSLEGDCTEHAVLLAALCRARQIPARVAFGLVYYPPQHGFAYHMWNEVWIEDRWVPIDGTLGLGGIGADHIKLADSDLAGVSAYAAMLPVVQVFGRLELEVVSVE
jgi:hypothetical protein